VRIDATPPFRLDLTATALRRLSTNVVDLWTPEGGYRRALEGGIVLEVTEAEGDAVEARLLNTRASPDALVRRIFGVDRDLRPFYRAVREVPWLDAIVKRMRGVKPPRYPTLWEAIVNAVVFQQVSLAAATSILRRVIEARTIPIDHHGERLYPFPGPERFLDIPVEGLRALGLSVNKARALGELAGALVEGRLDAGELERLPTPELLAELVEQRGIGPWTAAVIALRGFGRLDIFPLKDSGVAATLRLLADEEVDVDGLLVRLGEQRGMLYYHLLLGRLEARGELPRPRRQAVSKREA
jgi:DNA-3-methyladenine glycosylase II